MPAATRLLASTGLLELKTCFLGDFSAAFQGPGPFQVDRTTPGRAGLTFAVVGVALRHRAAFALALWCQRLDFRVYVFPSFGHSRSRVLIQRLWVSLAVLRQLRWWPVGFALVPRLSFNNKMDRRVGF